MDRRQFIYNTLVGSVVAFAGQSFGRDGKPASILLLSAWQTVNIGDIAHTPGILRLLETHLPEVKVVLWPGRIDFGVDVLLKNNFPNLRIVGVDISIEEAFEECSFLLHGSGANFVAQGFVSKWSEETGKPYGVFGITLSPQDSFRTKPTPLASLKKTVAVLDGADFVYFRDTKSIEFTLSLGCRCPVVGFAPDAAFEFDLRDDAKAGAFLSANGLETGQFVCCIPRLRYSPYWLIPSKNRKLDEVKHARNEQMKESDHAPLRKAIVRVVEDLGLKVLVCPEDRTHMKVGKEMIVDKLPKSVLKNVVWKSEFWRTDEALSTYIRSRGVFSNDLHSPVMCIGNGIPAIVCRWSEQTTKGLMWDDLGLSDWLFDFDKPEEVAAMPDAVVAMVRDRDHSKRLVQGAARIIESAQVRSMAQLRYSLGVGI